MSPAKIGNLHVEVTVQPRVRRAPFLDRHPVAWNLIDCAAITSLLIASWIVAIAFGYGLWHLFRSVFL